MNHNWGALMVITSFFHSSFCRRNPLSYHRSVSAKLLFPVDVRRRRKSQLCSRKRPLMLAHSLSVLLLLWEATVHINNIYNLVFCSNENQRTKMGIAKKLQTSSTTEGFATGFVFVLGHMPKRFPAWCSFGPVWPWSGWEITRESSYSLLSSIIKEKSVINEIKLAAELF